jgi:hypothetical protein
MIAAVGAYRYADESGAALAVDAVPGWQLGERLPVADRP